MNVTQPEWTEIVKWWELRRILYNLLMFCIGIASIQIAYVSIPLLYIIIGIALNIGYSFFPAAEHLIHQRHAVILKRYRHFAFASYLFASMLMVIGFAVLLRIS